MRFEPKPKNDAPSDRDDDYAEGEDDQKELKQQLLKAL